MSNDTSPSARARLLRAQGLTLEQIAEQTGLKPSEVKRAFDRNPKPGRPGGSLDIETQVMWARRILQSAQSDYSCELAAALLSSLMSDALRGKNGQGRG